MERQWNDRSDSGTAWNDSGTAWNDSGTAWNDSGTAWNDSGTAWNDSNPAHRATMGLFLQEDHTMSTPSTSNIDHATTGLFLQEDHTTTSAPSTSNIDQARRATMGLSFPTEPDLLDDSMTNPPFHTANESSSKKRRRLNPTTSTERSAKSM